MFALVHHQKAYLCKIAQSADYSARAPCIPVGRRNATDISAYAYLVEFGTKIFDKRLTRQFFHQRAEDERPRRIIVENGAGRFYAPDLKETFRPR